MIPAERQNGTASPNGARRWDNEEIDARGGLGELIVTSLVCAACWLAIGLLVVAAIMLRSGWMTPLLVGLALVVGAAVGLLPTLLFRRDAKLANAALRAVVAEAPEQALIDARARAGADRQSEAG